MRGVENKSMVHDACAALSQAGSCTSACGCSRAHGIRQRQRRLGAVAPREAQGDSRCEAVTTADGVLHIHLQRSGGSCWKQMREGSMVCARQAPQRICRVLLCVGAAARQIRKWSNCLRAPELECISKGCCATERTGCTSTARP
jgi:hypothetical protein